jgi:site-specific recombinase XerD
MVTTPLRLCEAIHWYEDVWLGSSGRSPSTVRAYMSDLRQFVSVVGTENRLGDISRDTIDRWLLGLRKRDYATASIQRKLTTIRLFFQTCKSRGFVPESPFLGFCTHVGAPKRLVRIINDEDLYRLLQHTDERVRLATEREPDSQPTFALRDRAIIRLLAVTGLRAQELASLTLSRMSLETGVLEVSGKGNRERLALLVDNADIVSLADYLRVRENLPLPHSFVFISRNGNPLRTNGLRVILRRLARACCAGTHITPHMFRHTAATRLMENGADIRVVQEFLGHASIRSTERYTHVSRRHLRAVLTTCHPLKIPKTTT